MQVAFSADDGVEIFGGSVDLKHVSAINCFDDALDFDMGWSGTAQFIVIFLCSSSDKAFEIGDDWSESASRLPFEVLSISIFAFGTTHAIIEVKDNASSGVVGNLEYFGDVPEMTSCSSATGHCSNFNLVADVVVHNASAWTGIRAPPVDSMLSFIDPRSLELHQSAFQFLTRDTIIQVQYVGAFGDDLWLSGLSILDDCGRLPNASLTRDARILPCGNSTQDIHVAGGSTWALRCTLHIMPGHTLSIDAGVTILGYVTDVAEVSVAPVIIVHPGATIVAVGTYEAPITFTSALPERHLPLRGAWGGLIVCGHAPVNGNNQTLMVEGVNRIAYGGSDSTDSSGVMRHVRVWYAGRQLSVDNEINAITLAGVGSGTVIENCEVAYGLDDGFEMFGGSVNLVRVSALFCADDAFDFDYGYNGTVLYAFGLVDNDGNHAVELGGLSDVGYISTSAELWSSTFVHQNASAASLLEIRAGSKVRIGTSILIGHSLVPIQTPFVQIFVSQQNVREDVRCNATADIQYMGSNRAFSTSQAGSRPCLLGRAEDLQNLALCYLQNIHIIDPDLTFRNCTMESCYDPRPLPGMRIQESEIVCQETTESTINFIGAFDPNVSMWAESFSLVLRDEPHTIDSASGGQVPTATNSDDAATEPNGNGVHAAGVVLAIIVTAVVLLSMALSCKYQKSLDKLVRSAIKTPAASHNAGVPETIEIAHNEGGVDTDSPSPYCCKSDPCKDDVHTFTII